MKYFLLFSVLTLFHQFHIYAQSKDIYNNSNSDKIAFVIGNSNYQNFNKLPTATNDVDSIKNALELCGFEVYAFKNLTLQQMDEARDLLASKLYYNKYSTAVWYFSGHGIEVRDNNYQVPVDAPRPLKENPNAIVYKCLHTKSVIDMIREKVKFPIIFLDACRTEVGKGINGDFSEVSADGTFVGLSTGIGTKSWEGGKNGIFTTAFLQHIFTPCQSINDFFDDVKSTCVELSIKYGLPNQKPTPYPRLDSKFYFVPCGTTIMRHNTSKPLLSDRDADGIPDSQDKCPDQYGTKSKGGCPDQDFGTDDIDGDGIIDTKDPCPSEKGTANGCPDYDSDGVPDKSDKCKDIYGRVEWEGCPDSDGDGIPDHKDDCPREKGSKSYGGCPPSLPKDSDSDGILDAEDKCPNEYGTKANGGCAAPAFATFTERRGGLVLNMIAIPGGSYEMGCTAEQGSDCKDE
jgi:hypothetical protein